MEDSKKKKKKRKRDDASDAESGTFIGREVNIFFPHGGSQSLKNP